MKKRRVLLGATLIAALVGATVSASAWAEGSASSATTKVILGTKAKEFALIAAKTGKKGKITFVVKNGGKMAHELVVLKTKTAAAKLPMAGGTAKEPGKLGDTGDIAPGKTAKLTLTLKPGHYVLLCNLPGHYIGGQYADFTVK